MQASLRMACEKNERSKSNNFKVLDAWLFDMCKRRDVTSEMWQVDSKIMTLKTKWPYGFHSHLI